MDYVLLIDKPPGITSHDVVNRVRRVARERRVGHAGTLDPFATGLLVVCIGRYTRLSNYLVGLDKQYLATVRLGFATDSQDLTGKQISPLVSSKHLTREDVEAVMREFTGQLRQTPPMFSAKKIGGTRLYEAARKGQEIERQPVDINVLSLEIVGSKDMMAEEGHWVADNEDETRDFIMAVHCSSGTYVRTLAHDIGQRLGVGAHLASLRRTAVGHLSLDRAVTLDQLEAAGQSGIGKFGIGGAQALSHLRSVALTADEGRRIANGVEILITTRQDYEPDELVMMLDQMGKLLAVGVFNVAGSIHPKMVMAQVEGERTE